MTWLLEKIKAAWKAVKKLFGGGGPGGQLPP